MSFEAPNPTKNYVPWASSPAARAVMQGNRKRDTNPELALRRKLHRLGMRYRVATRPSSETRWTADLVFRGPKLAVFVDGCFWHGCPEHFSPPRTNMAYWGPKILRNRERDALVQAEFRSAGWQVLRFWEHEDMEKAARRVKDWIDHLTAGEPVSDSQPVDRSSYE